ncbi:KRAB [Mytilus coruscus]|uniref:KRAB n=1 Tax=Mytilus coruscus TaxID=42192 RepID=A0A6J8A9U5_MYTCO|nr:KRAB [Mytilus coruscus]
MESKLYDGKGSSVPDMTEPGKKQSVDSMLIIKQEVVDNAFEFAINENYENLQTLISDSTTISIIGERNPDDAKNMLLDEIKQEPCSPESESTNSLLNGYIQEWAYLDKTAGNAEDNKSNILKNRTDGVTSQIPCKDGIDQEEPAMYIFYAENELSEFNDANENVNTGKVQNRRKRKGTKPKKIRQNVEKIEDLNNYSMWYCHFKTHNTKGDYKFQCSICTKFFLTGAHLKFHLKTHKHGNSKASENNQLKSQSTVAEQSGDYICTFCSDSFQDKISLKQHEILVHEEKLNGDLSLVGSDNFSIVDEMEDDMSGQSTDLELIKNNIQNDQSVLDQNLPVMQSTADHNLINNKNGDALLTQNASEKSLINCFESSEEQSIEKESSKFSEHDDTYLDLSSCSDSLKNAPDKGAKSDNKLKRFDCSECSKSFSRRDSLTTHFRIHTRQNIHECNLCGKIFPKRSNFIRHMESCGKRERRITKNVLPNETYYSEDLTDGEQFDASQHAHCDKTSEFSLEKHIWTHDQESFDEMKYKDRSEDLPLRKKLPKIQLKLSDVKESTNDSSVCEMTLTDTDDNSTEEPFDNTYMVQVKIEPEEVE